MVYRQLIYLLLSLIGRLGAGAIQCSQENRNGWGRITGSHLFNGRDKWNCSLSKSVLASNCICLAHEGRVG